MSGKDQRIYLQDILERIRRIEEIAALGRDAFLASTLHQDAAIRNFEVIGEIVKRLDVALTSQHPQVVWADYAGFRDVLIHQYDKVLLAIVWQSMENDLGPLKGAVQDLLQNLSGEDDRN